MAGGRQRTSAAGTSAAAGARHEEAAAGGANARSAPEVLGELATHFEATGQPVQAIHCLTALLAQTQLMPDVEVRARLALGRLLLLHTSNLSEAKKQLQRAVSSALRGGGAPRGRVWEEWGYRREKQPEPDG